MADLIALDRIESTDLDGELCKKAAFELRLMLGKGVVDFGRILQILDDGSNPREKLRAV